MKFELKNVNGIKRRIISSPAKQSTCLQCGKTYLRPAIHYMPSRGNGKFNAEYAKFTRLCCCSEKCFQECWKEVGVVL